MGFVIEAGFYHEYHVQDECPTVPWDTYICFVTTMIHDCVHFPRSIEPPNTWKVFLGVMKKRQPEESPPLAENGIGDVQLYRLQIGLAIFSIHQGFLSKNIYIIIGHPVEHWRFFFFSKTQKPTNWLFSFSDIEPRGCLFVLLGMCSPHFFVEEPLWSTFTYYLIM